MGAEFGTITEAAIRTGLSEEFIESGCKDGRIPCVKQGGKIKVNIPAMLQQTVFFDDLMGGDCLC